MQYLSSFYRIFLKKWIGESWLEIKPSPRFQRTFYIRSYNPKIINPSLKYSNCINLHENSEEELWNRIKSNFKNEIRKCNGKIEFAVVDERNIKFLEKEYNEFALTRGLTFFNKERALNTKSYLSVNNYESDKRVFNFYLIIEDYTFLIHSFSNSEYSKESSYALKRLHYESILYFKKIGLKYYDFGGISNKRELKGVNKLKEGFGGRPCVYFKGFFINSKISILLTIVWVLKKNFKMINKLRGIKSEIQFIAQLIQILPPDQNYIWKGNTLHHNIINWFAPRNIFFDSSKSDGNTNLKPIVEIAIEEIGKNNLKDLQTGSLIVTTSKLILNNEKLMEKWCFNSKYYLYEICNKD